MQRLTLTPCASQNYMVALPLSPPFMSSPRPQCISLDGSENHNKWLWRDSYVPFHRTENRVENITHISVFSVYILDSIAKALHRGFYFLKLTWEGKQVLRGKMVEISKLKNVIFFKIKISEISLSTVEPKLWVSRQFLKPLTCTAILTPCFFIARHNVCIS